MRIAVVSDVHGNDVAFEAVLKDARRRGYDALLDLGDTYSGPLRPLDTFERMAGLDVIAIAGNHERQLLTLPPSKLNASDAFTLDRLGSERVETLRNRKPTLRFEDVLMVHGSPKSDLEYLLEEIVSGLPVARDPKVVDAMTSMVEDGVSLVLCGHSHVQRAMRLASGILVVNPGSVGLPAFGNPGFGVPHRMESGSRHARYATLQRNASEWRVDFHLVDYDWATAASDARGLGRTDWAHAIETGFVFVP